MADGQSGGGMSGVGVVLALLLIAAVYYLVFYLRKLPKLRVDSTDSTIAGTYDLWEETELDFDKNKLFDEKIHTQMDDAFKQAWHNKSKHTWLVPMWISIDNPYKIPSGSGSGQAVYVWVIMSAIPGVEKAVRAHVYTRVEDERIKKHKKKQTLGIDLKKLNPVQPHDILRFAEVLSTTNNTEESVLNWDPQKQTASGSVKVI